MIKNIFRFNLIDSTTIDAYAARINDEYKNGQIGYYHLPSTGLKTVDEIYVYEKSLSYIKNIVLVGIGGSSLGVKAIRSMLKSKKQKRQLYVLDNVDPQSYKAVMDDIKFEETLFIVSSKSGNTIETITIFKCILDEFKPKNLSKNFLIITDSGTNLEEFAKNNSIKVFNIPQNVGGRFSVLSAIGLVPLALCGYDIKELLEGALECKSRYIDKNDTSLMAKAYHYAIHRNAHINVVFSYCDRFREFNDWYVQLWAESLGKKKGFKRVGRTPIGLIGSSDQHSFLQLIMDGIKDKTVTFIKICESTEVAVPGISLKGLEECDFVAGLSLNRLLNAQCDATAMALVQEGLSVDILELDRLDERHVGFLIFYYELLTSAVGVMLGVNTYDQPGVEIGKRILKTMLKK